jgi:hypothetical protein
MMLRIWGLAKPYWARWSVAASIRRSPLLGLGRLIASAAVVSLLMAEGVDLECSKLPD